MTRVQNDAVVRRHQPARTGSCRTIIFCLAVGASMVACKAGPGEPCSWHDDCGKQLVCKRTGDDLGEDHGLCVDGLEQAQQALEAITELEKRCEAYNAELREISNAAAKSGGPMKRSKIYGIPDADPSFVAESMKLNVIFGYARSTVSTSGDGDCNADTLEAMEILVDSMITENHEFDKGIIMGKGLR